MYPANQLNKLPSQDMYANLPTEGAVLKKDKLSLNKAVAKQNERGAVSAIQKAGRASEKAKKRAAEEALGADGGANIGAAGAAAGTRAKRARTVVRFPAPAPAPAPVFRTIRVIAVARGEGRGRAQGGRKGRGKS